MSHLRSRTIVGLRRRDQGASPRWIGTLVAIAVGVVAALSGCPKKRPARGGKCASRYGAGKRTTGTKTGFRPPNAAHRRCAIGNTTSLGRALRRAFAPSGPFRPVPAPAPGDWLADHDEPGQTFAQFVRARPNLPRGKRRTLVILPLGSVGGPGRPTPPALAAYLRAYYQLPVRVLAPRKVATVGVRERKHPRTGRQLHAGDVLRALERILPADAFCLIAITRIDLYPQASWNFVYGLASLRQRVGVFSFARHHPSFQGRPVSADEARRVLWRRATRDVVHEIGHMFGLQHCIHFRCVMNGSNHMPESDRIPIQLCPVCLRKLHHSVGFDVLARYRALAAAYARRGLAGQAAWYRRRIARIAAK